VTKQGITVCFYCARYHFEPMRTEPLGIRYLIAYLLDKQLLDIDNLHIVQSFEDVMRFNPDVLCVSSVTQVMPDAVTFTQRCRSSLGCITILGGYSVTASPKKLPEIFDIGVIGEGELTLAEVIMRIKERSVFDNIQNIKGICYHNSAGGVTVNPQREFIQNLDELPLPYWGNLIMEDIPVFTSRGCPYRCAFCDAHTFWRKSYRRHSAAYVVSMIETYVIERGAKIIHFLDDLWIADKSRFREIVDELEKRNLLGSISFYGFVRSNLIHEADILLLKRMKYKHVRFGAESASEQLLKRLKGDGISVTDHQRTIDLCHKYGISCSASFMFGVPGETMQDLEMTRRFLRYNRGKFFVSGIYSFTPIPGTPMYEDLKLSGVISDDEDVEQSPRDFQRENFSWKGMRYYNNENIPFAQFRKFVDQFRKEFAPSLNPIQRMRRSVMKKLPKTVVWRLKQINLLLQRSKNLNKPIFIVGHARAGSTLLAALVNWHTEVGPKHSIFRTSIDVNEVCKRALDENTHMDYGLSIEQTDVWSKFFRGVGTLANMSSELVVESSTLSEFERQQLIALLTRNFTQRRFLSKNPTNSFRVCALRQIFPDCKIVALYRSGPEVISSWGKRAYGFGKPFHYSDESHDALSYENGIRIFAQKWIDVLSYLEGVRSKMDFIALTYDDLIEDPQESLKKIFDYLELPVEPYIRDLRLADRREEWRRVIPVKYHDIVLKTCLSGQDMLNNVRQEFALH
jgi:anaerobic magnesium-protoporphyrin IX monomethyl ester cyclase